MIIEFYIGFYRPAFRNNEGRIDVRGWLGHVEVWGYTEDQTWFFLDPGATGSTVTLIHRYDDVVDRLAALFDLCDLIVKMPPASKKFRVPLHGPMTCAAIVGHMVGLRALFPSTLKRKVLRNGTVVSDGQQTEGRSEGQGSAPP